MGPDFSPTPFLQSELKKKKKKVSVPSRAQERARAGTEMELLVSVSLSHSGWVDSVLAAELFLNSCFLDTVSNL